MSICEEIKWNDNTGYYVKGKKVPKMVYDEVKDLERQLEESRNKLNKIESVCDGYKAMQSEFETGTEVPYWDIMNIIKGTTTEKFGYLKEQGENE